MVSINNFIMAVGTAGHLDTERINETVLVILGPTASGKTRLAVEVAKRLNGEIVSVDSRQVYKGMDIGTGKDLEEYGSGDAAIPYHLIDLLPAGSKYNVSRFVEDVDHICPAIFQRGKLPILCGGTGMYLDALLRGHDLLTVPVNIALRETLTPLTKDSLLAIWTSLPVELHPHADLSTHKRLIRAIEVVQFRMGLSIEALNTPPRKAYQALVFGLNPALILRRERISKRLAIRLEEGLVEEVQGLLQQGLKAEDLIYYGLEYKYITLYLQGVLDFETMTNRLETEIHRFAKRQMTFFRKMEKDGIRIEWMPENFTTEEQANYIVDNYRSNTFNDI